MPNAAIATEAVNAVEVPEHLGHTMIEGLLLPLVLRGSPIESDHGNAKNKIVDAVVGLSTIRACDYKHSTFERRVCRRMMDLRIDNLTDYADRVSNDGAEAQRLSQKLLIDVTKFFGDTAPYEVIQGQIIPQIM
ncbi:hypothetical protein [Parasphingorhabdus sp.]|uniref:hypothetical protein n=1 Tax=Parasphingorhabdus sp. TaxID=2709688 RepID=UPI003FA7B6AF